MVLFVHIKEGMPITRAWEIMKENVTGNSTGVHDHNGLAQGQK